MTSPSNIPEPSDAFLALCERIRAAAWPGYNPDVPTEFADMALEELQAEVKRQTRGRRNAAVWVAR